MDGDLYLDLIADAALGIGPEIGDGEAAGAGCLGEGPGDLVSADAHSASHSAIDLDFDGGILQLLLKLQVLQ